MQVNCNPAGIQDVVGISDLVSISGFTVDSY